MVGKSALSLVEIGLTDLPEIGGGGKYPPPRPSVPTALKHVLEWTKRGIILCVSHDGKALKRSVQTCLQASREHTLTLELVNKPSRSIQWKMIRTPFTKRQNSNLNWLT